MTRDVTVPSRPVSRSPRSSRRHATGGAPERGDALEIYVRRGVANRDRGVRRPSGRAEQGRTVEGARCVRADRTSSKVKSRAEKGLGREILGRDSLKMNTSRWWIGSCREESFVRD